MTTRSPVSTQVFSTQERLNRAITEAKEIWGDATFPERVATCLLADALDTVDEEVLVGRIIDTSDDFRALHNHEIVAASRALLRRAGIDECSL